MVAIRLKYERRATDANCHEASLQSPTIEAVLNKRSHLLSHVSVATLITLWRYDHEDSLAFHDSRSFSDFMKPLITCACRKLNPGILVMQSAQGWATTNAPGAIDGARDRCIFLQG